MIFKEEVDMRIQANGENTKLREASLQFTFQSILARYSYNFSWLGRPIIQYPQDILAIQELVWRVKPDLIIETGIAHGGSLVLNASLLALIDYSEAINEGKQLDPAVGKRRVLGLDVDIRSHNRAAIESHPMANKIEMIEGNSIAPEIIERVLDYAREYKKVFICLDSNHTHEHVLAELEAYAPLTSPGSYCVVFDTLIEDMTNDMFPERPWGKGNNPKTAVREYLLRLKEEGRKDINGMPLNFEVDKMIENKLLITVAPGGYLLRKP